LSIIESLDQDIAILNRIKRRFINQIKDIGEERIKQHFLEHLKNIEGNINNNDVNIGDNL
jgi:tRNA uridine 5-carbamoylmethylation protein Kti12